MLIVDASLLHVLQRAARRLNESWLRDVVPLRASRMLHGRIEPFLGKLANDGHLVGRLWYQDHVLGSVRRMVDTGDDVLSVRQALLDVRRVADEVTPQVLLELHGRDPQWDEEQNLSMTRDWVRRTVVQARPDEVEPDTSIIGQRTVQADLDRIGNVADRAHRLATLVAAHRLDTDEEVVVTDDEVDQLLEGLSTIYRRWSLPLRAVDVDTSIDHFQIGRRLAEALRLYDPDGVRETIQEYLLSRDPQTPTVRWNELTRRMRASYRIESEIEDGEA